MKTTVELSDALFHAAKRAAGQRKTTVKALIEQGLRAVVMSEAPAFLCDGHPLRETVSSTDARWKTGRPSVI